MGDVQNPKSYFVGNSLVTQGLGLGTFTDTALVQSLVGELNSHKPAQCRLKKITLLSVVCGVWGAGGECGAVSGGRIIVALGIDGGWWACHWPSYLLCL